MATFDPKQFLKTLPHRPGVYQMLNEKGDTIYVGKARDLKKRVSTYFQKKDAGSKTSAMVAKIAKIITTVTPSENEALLLESNLIKQLHPRYNVLLRDDKSYPYIILSQDTDYPRLDFYRGSKRQKGRYFGPFPSVAAVRDTLNQLQKIFKLRQCRDSFFANRTRPCLQYQIQRCTAPCVKYITPEDYAKDVDHTVMFLQGKSQSILTALTKQMKEASESTDYELAAHYRDQISSLRRIQQEQNVLGQKGDVDVIALVQDDYKNVSCISLLCIRNGQVLGQKSFFPKVPKGEGDSDIMASFIAQFYLIGSRQQAIPKELILSSDIDDATWLENALSEAAESKVSLSTHVRSQRAQWLKIAMMNAKQTLQSHLDEQNHYYQRFEALRRAFSLDTLPVRLECFDVSHTMGEATVASCVVFDEKGPRTSDYRRFNIKDIQSGDDYAAMRQALQRRYTRLKKGEGLLPDILFIDGGKGQLTQAQQILEELQVSGLLVIGIAKGPERKPGMETLFIMGQNRPIHLAPDAPALHLIQHIRDEAHRFAITGHRAKRDKQRQTSTLENIPGVGAVKRRELLQHFGGLQAVKRASIDELAKVPGISHALASQIYDILHA